MQLDVGREQRELRRRAVKMSLNCIQVIEGSSGPMARSIRDLDLFSRVVLKAEPWTVDPGLIPLPWTPVTAMPAMSKLRVGIMKDDGVVMPTPSVLRALAAAECKLAAESTIEVVRFEPYRHEKAASLAVRLQVFSLMHVFIC